jgi:cold shock CspA family protein
MAEKVSIGTIKKVDPEKGLGIILEEGEATSSAATGSAYFTLDGDDSENLKEGQLVQFVKEETNAGPRAKRIMVLIDKS